MIDQAVHPAGADDANAASCAGNARAELARGDALVRTVPPVLRYLLEARDSAIFSDEILARIRAMLADLARRLLEGARAASARTRGEATVQALLDEPAILAHLHAVAMEWRLTEQMQASLALDPVSAPLVQSLLESSDDGVRAPAMAFLAPQARWCQAQRRMQSSLHELPGDLLDTALQVVGAVSGGLVPDFEAQVRRSHHAAADRLDMAARLVASLDGDAPTALLLAHGGVALFFTALAGMSGQRRETLLLSVTETGVARLALALRAAGLPATVVEEQCFALLPDAASPAFLAGLDVAGAAAALSAGPART